MPKDGPESETGDPESEPELSRLEAIGLVVAAVFLTALMGGLVYMAGHQ